MAEHEWRGAPIETEMVEGTNIYEASFGVPDSFVFWCDEDEEEAVRQLKRKLDELAAIITPTLSKRVRELEARVLEADALLEQRVRVLEVEAHRIREELSVAESSEVSRWKGKCDGQENHIKRLKDRIAELDSFVAVSQQLSNCLAEFGDEKAYLEGKCLCTSSAEHVQAWDEALGDVLKGHVDGQ